MICLPMRGDPLDAWSRGGSLRKVLEIAARRIDGICEGWGLKGVFQGKENTQVSNTEIPRESARRAAWAQIEEFLIVFIDEAVGREEEG